MVIWGTRDEKRRIIRSSKNLSDQKRSSFDQQQSVSISVAFYKPIFKNNNGSFGKAVKCFFISIKKSFPLSFGIWTMSPQNQRKKKLLQWFPWKRVKNRTYELFFQFS